MGMSEVLRTNIIQKHMWSATLFFLKYMLVLLWTYYWLGPICIVNNIIGFNLHVGQSLQNSFFVIIIYRLQNVRIWVFVQRKALKAWMTCKADSCISYHLSPVFLWHSLHSFCSTTSCVLAKNTTVLRSLLFTAALTSKTLCCWLYVVSVRPINKSCTYSPSTHTREHREAWLSFSQVVPWPPCHRDTQ